MKQEMKAQLITLKQFLNKYFFTAFFSYLLFAAVFFITTRILVNIKFLLKIDVAIQNAIIDVRNDTLTNILKIFTDLNAATLTAFLTIIVGLILFFKKDYLYSIGAIFSVGISELASFILKEIFQRHRPPEYLALVEANGNSFPSGHTIAAISFYGFLAFIFYKKIKNKAVKKLLISVCVIIILLAGFARVYLGVHWPSDVAAGYIIGGAWLLIMIKIVNKQGTIENTKKL